eukprot:CAMPEP_0174361608 /NCGR_PEP_ID=MMETSP0811_2-20130205/59989_1 /TAXON_ID=73025 ORGANISM="Eutreptiella gymnastica-like, Strain CCMP1594" /NCGR_SAMPLE_ID=MMETSP0811_2 /ASSEMBLY_ACC=CAM_ASM_000667 /LENGTH=224 /DNA_ID=CAMNT_0015498401 /DNA_START=32 /DNA_END=703 /DNA_ORIENTATION=+
MPSVIDKMKDMKARATPYYQPEQEEDSLCPKLSLKQRITGFATCAGLGFFCMVLVMFSIFPIPSPVRMGFFLTLGNLFAITSTGFLVGPMRQLKKMFEKTRIVAALMFLLFMVLTLLSAIWLKSALLTIAFCLCQYCALVWYGLSYIPYGRTAAKKAMNTVADAIEQPQDACRVGEGAGDRPRTLGSASGRAARTRSKGTGMTEGMAEQGFGPVSRGEDRNWGG